MATKMTILGSGNVGIGTTTPTSKLDVTTTALGVTQTTTSGLALVNTTAAALGAQQISPALRWSGFGWKTDATAASQAVDFRSYVVPVQGAANPTGYLAFESSVNGGAYSATPPFVITSGGNIGIGTTSPGSILALGGTAARIFGMDRNTTAATSGQGLTVSSGGAIAGTADLAGGDLTLKSGISTGTGSSAIHFYTATAGVTGTADNTPTEKVTILGAGHVGINQTSPTSKLHIVGTGTYGAAGVSSLNSAAHTVTLSGADPTTYATFYANQLGAMTLTGTNANQTVTDAAGLAVSPAIKSTNVAITNTHGILVPATAVSTATNAYGLTVNAPTGATNNYAAAFVTGNVGIGTTAPGGNLHIKDNSGAGYPEVLVLEAEDTSDPGYRFKRESAGTSGDYYVRLRGSPGSTWLALYSNN